MSIQAVGWALEQNLPARPKLVLCALANRADHEDGYCWMKADRIGREAACSPRAVFNFIGDLIRNGYVRKAERVGDDGKQRANDYWILLDRDPSKPWNSDRTATSASETDEEEEATISGEPHAPGACGESVDKSGDADCDTAPGAVGPHASTCIRERIAEPSKTNPEKKDGAHPFASAPRSYKPPPLAPEAPQGALHPNASKPIFVYAGTRAWDAWVAFKKRERGINWTLTTTITIEGQRRTGWSFPTLFPPDGSPGSEAPDKQEATGPPSKITA